VPTFTYPDIPYEYRSAATMVSALELGLTVGLLGSAERAMISDVPKLSNSTCGSVRQHFARLQAKLAELKAIEAEWGVGCLLDLDHPLVIALTNARKVDGRPAIPADHIAAATRYQSIKSSRD
jgi:hypothetical protein